MGISNPIHIVFLLMIMLLVFGAKRLPEMGRSLGEGLRGFKNSLEGESALPGITTSTASTATPSVPVAAPRTTPQTNVALADKTNVALAEDAEVVAKTAETTPSPERS